MRHQQILLELASSKAAHPQEPHWLQPSSRTKRFLRKASLTHPSKKYYKSTRNSTSLIHQPSKSVVNRISKRKRQRRQASWTKLVILAPSFILILLILRWLISFLPNYFPAVTLQQFENYPQLSVSLPQTSPVDALSRAIIAQESTDNFQSLNPHSQALGLAQVMPDNLSDWSKEALGYRLKVDEFLNNPELQKKIIDHRLSKYWQEALTDSNGDEDLAVLMVASRWYSGSSDNYDSKAPQWYKGKAGKLHRYPSVAEYSNSVLEKYRQFMTNNS